MITPSWSTSRYRLLWAAAGFFLSMLVLSSTDLAWKLTGSPAEEYPELFFVIFGLPSATLLLVLGALSAATAGLGRFSRLFVWIAAFLAASFALLVASVFLPTAWVPEPLTSLLGAVYLFGVLPFTVLLAIAGGIVGSRGRKRMTAAEP